MSTLPGYYELEPENNTFTDVTADVTHQCNMTCSNCYIPNRDIPDIPTIIGATIIVVSGIYIINQQKKIPRN